MEKLRIDVVQRSSIFGNQIFKNGTLDDLADLLSQLAKISETGIYTVVIKKQKQTKEGVIKIPISVFKKHDTSAYINYSIYLKKEQE